MAVILRQGPSLPRTEVERFCMLTLDPLFVLLPAGFVAMALFGYARVLIKRRKAEQMRPKPVPVTSKRRFESKDTLS